VDELAFDGAVVIARLGTLPGARELLQLAAERRDVELVGGSVRDLLLGREPRELDVVVGEDAAGAARALAARLGAPAVPCEHERFGTASVRFSGGRIDLATRRAEQYAAPGALPRVRAGTPEQDLRRRDFTVNAIAVALDPAAGAPMRAVEHAREDLIEGRLRVLHRDSFRDDPTRLLRLARYGARLGFAAEQATAALAREALAARALDTVSGARTGAELRLALAEPDACAALAALAELGVLVALHPRLRFQQPLARAALALLAESRGECGVQLRPDLLLLASTALALVAGAGEDPRGELGGLLDRLEFAASDRDRVVALALAAPRLIEQLPAATTASGLAAVVAGLPPEAVALAGAASEPAAEPARRWLGELQGVSLRIDGNDLIAAGMPEGPEVGRRLRALLDDRLDGELPDERDAQLRAALERT
jgi:tRNA nucleotidyltransferase (CCA-adding enzyme)